MPYELCEFPEEGGKEMVRINLLPEGPGAEIWRKLEKAIWIFWFLLPFAIFLWAKLAVNSK
jgi:hypothetical protein